MKKFIMMSLVMMSITSHMSLVNAETEQLKDTVSSINEAWNDAFNRGDEAELAQLYAEDAILSPGNGTVITGRREIEALFKSFIDNGMHDHHIKTISYHRDGSNLYQVAEWQVSSKDEQTQFRGILTSVYKIDQQGNWITHSHVWNVQS